MLIAAAAVTNPGLLGGSFPGQLDRSFSDTAA